ncbi:MAG: U32 family peptidase C-terminal domain-containing protein [Candidatus Falkowbacteria bacterium]|nr:MAG: U32 family peptidase C-terminal domain-containing protein [Candidatus Falkowbacteria bacterium]
MTTEGVKIKKPKLELLAPAGNMLKLQTALVYGADAVYLGIPDFSLRVRINDFDFLGIKKAVADAHQQGKRAYITVNIFAHNQHFSKLEAYLKKLKPLGVDAFIVSDPGVLSLIKKIIPSAELHLSTQANCTNLEAARFWFNQGVSRVVLGREVTLAEIKAIHRALPKLELEYFVHGAMCMAYSGRCFLSKMFVNRSGNLGDCAQPCRWQYDVNRYTIKARGHEEDLELVEEEHGTYLLNSKDLCLIKYLPELIKAGVTSFKIEGRAKSVYYQATVCAIYRRALNLIASKTAAPKLKKELAYLYKELETKLIHRGYTTGFLLGDKAEQNIADSHNKSDWEFCGQVVRTVQDKDGKTSLLFKVHNTIKLGDEIEIIGFDYDIIKMKLQKLISAKTQEELTEAHGGGGAQKCLIQLKKNIILPELAVIRRQLKSEIKKQ